MTEYFLREETRQSLIQELLRMGVPQDAATNVASFPPEDADKQLFAHAAIMADAVSKRDQEITPEQRNANIALSAACFGAISKESDERGMTDEDFPIATLFMERFNATSPKELNNVDPGLGVEELINLLKGKAV